MISALYMDAVITPNRSLSERGFVILIGIITLANVASAAVFVAMGAHWAPVFLAIDLAAVIVAFLVSFQRAKNVERVQVSPHQVVVTYETPRWTRVVWESPTAFTRVTVDRDDQDGRVLTLKLALSGRERPVAVALSPRERGEFARALEDAIWRAKRGR